MRRAWVWLALLALPVYAATFSRGEALGRSSDVIADADTAAYVLLLTEWSAQRQYGDAWRPIDRHVGDQAQEHKIKHVLLPLVAGPASRSLTAIGVSPLMAAKLPVAVIGAINLLLIGSILASVQVRSTVIAPLVALTAAAPFQWVYASLPDSWPLSGMLVLLTVLLTVQARPWPLIGVVVGIAMLNNVTLGALAAAPGLYRLRRLSDLGDALRVGAGAAAVAIVVWLLSLTALGWFDPDLRPDRVVAFLRYFPSMLEASSLPPWSPHLLRMSLEQWLFTAFVSSQHNVRLVGWGLGETWRVSLAGRAAIAAIAVLWLSGVWTWLGRARSEPPNGARRALTVCLGLGGILWAGLHLASPTTMLFYSPTLSPLAVLAAGVALSEAPRARDRFLFLAPALVLPASASQILFLQSYLN